MQLDKQHPVPVYRQLKEMLQSQIEQGAYYSHQKLPSERDLCRNYNLSRMTARRALQELIEEGYAYTRTGKGTFVSENIGGVDKAVINTRLGRVTKLGDVGHTEFWKKRLVDHLLAFDSIGIEQVINQALAVNSVETLATGVFLEVIRDLEQRWHKGQINLLTQNYAVTTLRCQLTALVSATASFGTGIKVLLACAPEDQHEIGILSLALSLRRRGFIVIYLGPNVSTVEFYKMFEMVQPHLICFSAATEQAARRLAEFSHTDSFRYEKKSLITFGGVAFNRNSSLIPNVFGLYLGNSIDVAVSKIEQLFHL